AVAASFILVTLVLLHGMTSWPTPATSLLHGSRDQRPRTVETPSNPVKDAPEIGSKNPPAPAAETPQRFVYEIQNPRDLLVKLKAFAEQQKTLVADVYLQTDVDLNQDGRDEGIPGRVPGLVFHGKPGHVLTIQAKPDSQTRPSIRLSYKPDPGVAELVWT